jgi:thiol-disulfide isomerase/thioredoxin
MSASRRKGVAAKWLVLLACALAGALGTGAAAATPETLTLTDLVNRPDHWPATVILQGDFKFSTGAVVHKGDSARVARFDGSRVLLITSANLPVNVAPADCGLLDAANQAWAELTPAQRSVDPESLSADTSLWPAQVTTTAGINSKFGKLASGTSVRLVAISKRDVSVALPNSPNFLTLDFGSTDVFARARQLATMDRDARPSRLAAALQGILVDSDGAAYKGDLGGKKLFALYFGANWCAPCHAFSPDFVKFVDTAMPRHPELAVVLLSNDEQTGQMLAYMKEEKMPFPAVPLKELNESSLLSSYAAKMIPHLVIVDRFGKVLASNDDDSGNRADPKDTIQALGRLLADSP